jgi:hypothetical protein
VAHLATALGGRLGEFEAALDLPALAAAASQATPRQVQTIAALMDMLENTQRQVFLDHLDPAALAAVLSDAAPGELQCIAPLVSALPRLAGRLVDHMNVPKIAETILSSHAIHAHQLRLLLRALGARAPELLEFLTAEPGVLAARLAAATASEMAEIGALIRETNDGKRLIGQHLDLAQFVELARHGTGLDLLGITIFTASLGDEERAEFAGKVDWTALLADIRVTNATVQAIGLTLLNAIRFGVDPDAARNALASWIAEKMPDLRHVVRREYATMHSSGGARVRRWSALAVLFSGIAEVSVPQARSLALGTRRSLRRSIDRKVADESLGRLLETLEAIAPGEFRDLEARYGAG